METYQLALPTTELEAANVELPPRLTIGIGRPGHELLFEAEPLDGTIRVTAYGGTDLTFYAEDLGLIGELLSRCIGE